MKNITFAILPQFEVLEIQRDTSVTKYSGIIKNIVAISKAKPNWVVTLYTPQKKFIQGRFSEIDTNTFQTVIDIASSEFSTDLVIGEDYPLLDGH